MAARKQFIFVERQQFSAIDNALWSIRSQATGLSLSRLLGARRHDKVMAYASTLFRETPEGMKAAAQGYIDKGFHAVKFGWGVFGEDPGRDRELVAAARETLGPKRHLLVDPGWYPAGWKKPGPMRSRRQAIELVEDRSTKEAFDPKLMLHERIKIECMERGLLAYPMPGTIDGKRPQVKPRFVLGLPRWWQPATARLKAARSTSRRIHTSFLPAGVQYCRGGMARTTRQRLPIVASLLGVGSGVVWSFGTIAGRRANHADVFQYLFWRSIGIVLVIEVIALARRQSLRIKAAWTSGRTMAIANLGLFVASMCFVYAVKTTTPANAAFLGSLTPLIAVLLSRLLGERLSRSTIVALVVALVGLWVLHRA